MITALPHALILYLAKLLPLKIVELQRRTYWSILGSICPSSVLLKTSLSWANYNSGVVYHKSNNLYLIVKNSFTVVPMVSWFWVIQSPIFQRKSEFIRGKITRFNMSRYLFGTKRPGVQVSSLRPCRESWNLRGFRTLRFCFSAKSAYFSHYFHQKELFVCKFDCKITHPFSDHIECS